MQPCGTRPRALAWIRGSKSRPKALAAPARSESSLPMEEFESRSLINASGRWSNLNLAPTENGIRHQKWLGVKAHFAEPPSEPSVDLYFFEGGYCGVQPVGDGRVNASAMVRADVASSLPEVFAQHPALRDRSRNWSLVSDPGQHLAVDFS